MKKIINIILSLVVILYAIYYLCIPFALNSNFGQNIIKNTISKFSDISVEYKNLKIKTGLVPSLIISADEINACDENLVLKNSYLNLRLIPLIFNKVSVKSFNADFIKANFTLDKHQNLYIGKYLIKPVDSDTEVEVSNLKLLDYNILFNDEINNKNGNFSGKRVELKKIPNRDIYLYVNGEIKTAKNISGINLAVTLPDFKKFDEIKLHGYLTNFDFSEISSAVSYCTKNSVEKISGVVNLQAKSVSDYVHTDISLENFFIKLKNMEKPIYLNNKGVINSDFKISDNILYLKAFNLKAENINVSVNGSVENITSKDPNTNIEIKIKDTKSENCLSLIPYMNFPQLKEVDLKKIRDYGIYSVVNGSMKLLGSSQRPDIYGSFAAKDLYIYKPLNIPRATLKLDFNKDKVFFDAFVPASKTQHVKVVGNVEMYDEKLSDIDITSTSSVDLATAEFILNPLHEILTFELGPVPIMDIKGLGNIKLKVKGNKIYPHLFGVFKFREGTVKFNDVNAVIKNASGELDFNDEKMEFITKYATLNNASIKVNGKCTTQGKIDFDVISAGQSLNEMLKTLNSSPMLSYLNKPSQQIKAASGKVNLSMKIKGKIKYLKDFKMGETIIPSGHITLLNNSVILGDSIFRLNNITGKIDFNNKDVNFDFYPLIDGQKLKIEGSIKNNKIYLRKKLNNLQVKIKDTNVLVKRGEFNIAGDKLYLNSIYGIMENKPFSVNGTVVNIYDSPKLDIYLTAYLQQTLIDKYINKKFIYPLKVKGDTLFSALIKGSLNNIDIKGNVNIPTKSSIYYKGALIEDPKHAIKLDLDINVVKNCINIKNFQYNKINDKNKVVPFLKSSGKIKLKNKNIYYDNFKVKTFNNTDARIFNVIFTKPIIKEGVFNSNLTVNGDFFAPSILGTFNISGINAPFFDTIINDINIVFKHKTADIKMKGNVFSNEINISANINNNFKKPYVVNRADVNLGNFNVNIFLKHLDKFNLEDVDNVNVIDSTSDIANFNICDLTIKQFNIKAKSVYIRKLLSQNFDATFSLNNGLLKLEKLKFVTADGVISGKMFYNFKSSKMKMSLIMDKINANTLSEALFNINNQIFGNLSGNANLMCNGKSNQDCMKTLEGDCNFNVTNGRMPKLGSLEYLLRSSNVLRSGITGLTINGIIDLLSPLQTGYFESIKGDFTIQKGVSKDLNIASKGKNLSIFISGEHNFATSDANLEIYGRVTKKINNKLGVVGNVSVNTLFNSIPGVNLSKTNQAEFIRLINKIPGLELNTNKFRIFFVKFDGNLNTETYKQTFKWID